MSKNGTNSKPSYKKQLQLLYPKAKLFCVEISGNYSIVDYPNGYIISNTWYKSSVEAWRETLKYINERALSKLES